MTRFLLLTLLASCLWLFPSQKAKAAEVYVATNMYHNTGRQEPYCPYSSNTVETCWRASQAEGWRSGHMVFGPYATDIPVGDNIAEWTLGFPAGSGTMVQLQVYDYTLDTILAARDVAFNEVPAGTSGKIKVPFVNLQAGDKLEFRVYWNGVGTADVFHTEVVGSLDVIASYIMNPPVQQVGTIFHQRGRPAGSDWSANPSMDTAGHLSYGPYVSFGKAHKMTALFKLKIDDNTKDNANVAIIEVRDATTAAQLAVRVLTRKSFTSANAYNYFPLQFYVDGFIPQKTNPLEFRVYWYANSTMTQTTLVVHDWGIGYDPLF
jgi:hypothetical protein